MPHLRFNIKQTDDALYLIKVYGIFQQLQESDVLADFSTRIPFFEFVSSRVFRQNRYNKPVSSTFKMSDLNSAA